MVVFKASEKLATAYGVAVTMDLMLTTTLFCVYAAAKLNWARWQILAFALVFGLIEFNFFAVSTRVSNIPHVPAEQRVRVDDLGDPYDHISHVTLNFGFQDDQDVPAGLALAVEQGLDASLDDAVYFVSRITIHRSDRPGMAQWRKRLFVGLAHNAATPVEYFRLPIGRTVVMGAQVRF